MNKIEIGKRQFKIILGDKASQVITDLESNFPELAKYIFEFVYGDIYLRKGLENKTRELAGVACLIGQGISGKILKTHIHGMLNTGWSRQEVIELFLFLLPYKGFPAIIKAMEAAREVFNAQHS